MADTFLNTGKILQNFRDDFSMTTIRKNHKQNAIESAYIKNINDTLIPKITEKAFVIDLFAGCGGLSLGFEAAGYKSIGYEMAKPAVETYNRNLKGHCYETILSVGYDYPKADIIVGGPPCQPFSVRGKQNGMKDARDGFPIFIDAVKRLQPKVFMFENVRNLAFSHKWYLDLIIMELRNLGYLIECKCLNAVNYGIPQNRKRIIVVGHRSKFKFPIITNKEVTVGEAIGDTMNEIIEGCHILTTSQDRYIAEYEKKSDCINPRDLYANRPARTITCRNLAGATSDMQRVRLPDGRRRRIIQREAARLQSFPDWFEFCGNETQQFTQIGNAVPPLLSYKLATCIKETLSLEEYSIRDIEKMNNMLKPLFDF